MSICASGRDVTMILDILLWVSKSTTRERLTPVFGDIVPLACDSTPSILNRRVVHARLVLPLQPKVYAIYDAGMPYTRIGP